MKDKIFRFELMGMLMPEIEGNRSAKILLP